MPVRIETIHALLLAAQAAIAAAMEMLSGGGEGSAECRHTNIQQIDSPGRPRIYCSDCGMFRETIAPEAERIGGEG